MSTTSPTETSDYLEKRYSLEKHLADNNQILDQAITEIAEAYKRGIKKIYKIKRRREENEEVYAALTQMRNDEDENSENRDTESSCNALEMMLKSNETDIFKLLADIKKETSFIEKKTDFVEEKMRENISMKKQLEIERSVSRNVVSMTLSPGNVHANTTEKPSDTACDSTTEDIHLTDHTSTEAEKRCSTLRKEVENEPDSNTSDDVDAKNIISEDNVEAVKMMQIVTPNSEGFIMSQCAEYSNDFKTFHLDLALKNDDPLVGKVDEEYVAEMQAALNDLSKLCPASFDRLSKTKDIAFEENSVTNTNNDEMKETQDRNQTLTDKLYKLSIIDEKDILVDTPNDGKDCKCSSSFVVAEMQDIPNELRDTSSNETEHCDESSSTDKIQPTKYKSGKSSGTVARRKTKKELKLERAKRAQEEREKWDLKQAQLEQKRKEKRELKKKVKTDSKVSNRQNIIEILSNQEVTEDVDRSTPPNDGLSIKPYSFYSDEHGAINFFEYGKALASVSSRGMKQLERRNSSSEDEQQHSKSNASTSKEKSRDSKQGVDKKTRKEWKLEKEQREQEEKEKEKLELIEFNHNVAVLTPIIWRRFEALFTFLNVHRSENTVPPIQPYKGNMQHKILAFNRTPYYWKKAKLVDYKKYITSRLEKWKKNFEKTTIYTVLLKATEPEYRDHKLAIEVAQFLSLNGKDVKEMERTDEEFQQTIENVLCAHMKVSFDIYLNTVMKYMSGATLTERDEELIEWKRGFAAEFGIPDCKEKYNQTQFFKDRLAYYWNKSREGEQFAEIFCVYMYLHRQGPDHPFFDFDFHILCEASKVADDENWLVQKEHQFFGAVFQCDWAKQLES